MGELSIMSVAAGGGGDPSGSDTSPASVSQARAPRTSPTSSASSTSSTASTSSASCRILRFFVFNPDLGSKEGEEHKKVVYFYSQAPGAAAQAGVPSAAAAAAAKGMDLQEQCKYVGLAEATMRFAKVFSNSGLVSGLSTSQTKSAYLEPEDGFVMVLTVSVPVIKYRRYNKVEKRSVLESDFAEEAVHENVLRAVLAKSYAMFRLFTGGFRHLLLLRKNKDDDAVEALKGDVAAFFSRFLASGGVDVDKADLAGNLFSGVQFLTVENPVFLKVHSFVARLVHDEFPGVLATALLLHRGLLVFSGLQQDESALICSYVNHHHFFGSSSGDVDDRSSTSTTTTSGSGPFGKHRGRFLVSPNRHHQVPAAADRAGQQPPLLLDASKVPKVHVRRTSMLLPDGGDDLQDVFHLILYHAAATTICLVVPSEVDLTEELARGLDAHLGPRLAGLSSDLEDASGGQKRPFPAALPVQAAHADDPAAAGVASVRRSSSTSNVHSGGGGAGSLAVHPGLGGALSVGSSIVVSAALGSSDEITEDNMRFFYYNATNRAMKSTLMVVSKPGGGGGKSGSGSDNVNAVLCPIPCWHRMPKDDEHDVGGTMSDVNFLRDALHEIAQIRQDFDVLASRW